MVYTVAVTFTEIVKATPIALVLLNSFDPIIVAVVSPVVSATLTFGFRANFISITGPELKYQEFSNEVSYEICRLVYSNNYLYVLQTEHVVYSSSETYRNTASKIYNFSWSGNTFKWNNGASGTGYTFDSITQMNHSGTTYYWVAFA